VEAKEKALIRLTACFAIALTTIKEQKHTIKCILESRAVIDAPDFVLFAQHGWADNSKAIATLARAVATPKTLIITPDLGWVETWIRIDPLIQNVKQMVIDTLARYPKTPIRIIGHSMGGLIWLEVLSRHPQWWSRVHSLVLIASPIGGADLARILDPLGLGIGMARDLGMNRREMAELIATAIPTLVIAGDIDNGSDGTITVGTTRFSYAKFVCLPGLSHAVLKNHPDVVETIQSYWANLPIPIDSKPDLGVILVQRLRSVPGMTDAHRRDFYRSKLYLRFQDGTTIRTWKNPVQVEHVFVSDSEGQCLYAGFVGWLHAEDLRKTLEDIKKHIITGTW
jgi:pimeloyl-ACP methyl ester carboxylesterase